VWWVSEFLRYILRTQPDTAKMLEDVEKSLEFAKPIVGIHVRRTDKVGTEAAYHSVEEYMKYVSLTLKNFTSVEKTFLKQKF
jgi:glycoprotein 6-alpha-L-fucosyltransferase